MAVGPTTPDEREQMREVLRIIRETAEPAPAGADPILQAAQAMMGARFEGMAAQLATIDQATR